MLPEDLEALVLSDAVGALVDAERAALRIRLHALPPEDMAEVAAVYESATLLATDAETEPPAHLRDRIMAAIAMTAADEKDRG